MEKLVRALLSYKASIILLLIYAAVMALATVVEKNMGTIAAKMLIYYSPVFFFLQLLLVVNFLLLLKRYRYLQKKKWSLFVIHLSLIIILGGAFVTCLFGIEGQVHIREGESSNELVIHSSRGSRIEKLPFRLELIDFRLLRYPGSHSPSSYESSLLIYLDGEVREAEVSMNNVLDLKGYRFFQASYDQDERGTILSVNRDPVGRSITYIGYTLLLVGFLMMFLMPESRFRKLIRDLQELRRTGVAVFMFVMLTGTIVASEHNKPYQPQSVVPLLHAAQFGELPILFRGRIMPMNSFSSDVLRKLHKETTFAGLNSNQFMLGIFVHPEQWMRIPLIRLPNKDFSSRFQLPYPYAAYSDFFNRNGDYLLLPALQQAYHKAPTERNAIEKELIKMDERVNIFYQLLQHTLPPIFPLAVNPNLNWMAPGGDLSLMAESDSVFVTQVFSSYVTAVKQSVESKNWTEPDQLLSEIKEWQLQQDVGSLIQPKKIIAEVRYNKLSLISRARIGYFLFGGLLLILCLLRQFNERQWMYYPTWGLFFLLFAVFISHLYAIGLRWYIAGHAPWSNSYETMVYISWVTLLAGFIFGFRNNLILALSALFGGVILFVSGLNWMDPQINSLVPVLKSPWLMFHVAVIVAAYGFFGVSFLLGTTNLLLMSLRNRTKQIQFRIKELTLINHLSLMGGLALMTIGTFLGAVWANESWGRYWGWDPKETWALITVVVYSVVTHLHLAKGWYSEWLFNFLSVVAFASVLMTFFGVNYFLRGMHSYGQIGASSTLFFYILIGFTVIGALALIAYKRRELPSKEQ